MYPYAYLRDETAKLTILSWSCRYSWPSERSPTASQPPS